MLKYPIDLTLGATICEICNLECKFCTRNLKPENFDKDSFYKKRLSNTFGNFMSIKTFRDILNNIDLKISRFFILGLGEPLLNPQFLEILKECSNTNTSIEEFIIYTNGVELSTQKSQKILEILKNSQKRFTFVFSVGAFNEQTYFSLKNKDVLKKVVSNIKYFIKNIKSSDIDNLYITVQCVVCHENSEEIREFFEFWRNEFKRYDIQAMLENDTEFEIRKNTQYKHSISIIPCIGENPQKDISFYRKVLKCSGLEDKILDKGKYPHGDKLFEDIYKRPACPDIFRYPFLFIDGTLSVCCYDIEFKAVYGDLSKQRLSEIFLSEKAQKWRQDHISGKFQDIEICRNCVGSDHIYLKNSEIQDYCKFSNLKDQPVKYFTRTKTGNEYSYRNILIYDKDFDARGFSAENVYADEIVDDLVYKNFRKLDDFKDYRIETEDNTLLPCSHWFSTLILKDGRKYMGCDLSRISQSAINISEILNGDYNRLPEKCLNCIKRAKIDNSFFKYYAKKLNPYWKDLIFSEEELDMMLPDFNKIDIEEFLETDALYFRESWKRIILKYSNNKEILLKISELERFPQDIFIFALLAQKLFINNVENYAENILSKAFKLNPCKYFENILKFQKTEEYFQDWEKIFQLEKFGLKFK